MNNKTIPRAAIPISMASTLPAISTVIAVFLAASSAAAFELGHSRVVSEPGQPLVVQVPVTNMTPEELNSFSASLAPASVWQSSGLQPPVPLDSISLTVNPWRRADSRLIELRSTQAAQTPVVDVMLAISTSAASRTVQTSIIVPPPPKVRLAGDQVVVQRGDTLSGIAKQFPVQGANLYQQLWALYSSNPDAFLRQNMNLLKAGAALRIPDPDAVRAVDPAFAKAQFLEHVRAFRQGRGGGQGDAGVPADAAAQTLQSPPEQQQGRVEQGASEPPAPANDQVRLTAAQQDAQAQADASAAWAKAVAEELERTQTLEQNISALQGAIASSANSNQTQTEGQASAAGANAAMTGSTVKPADSSGSGDQTTAGSDRDASGQAGSNGGDGAGSASGSESSGGVFARASQWVSDNTTAAIALLLALIALILAWALRATKSKVSTSDAIEQRVDHAATDFEQKLKDIDLSLDGKTEPGLSKPEEKA